MTHSDLFVVRIWHQIAGGLRASVRKVDEEETRHFSEPDQAEEVADGYRQRGLRAASFHNGDGFYVRVSR